MKCVLLMFCVVVNLFLGDCMGIDFSKASASKCEKFGEGVKSGKICGDKMTDPLKKAEEMASDSDNPSGTAINIIKNLSIAAYHVPMERTDFQSACMNTLLNVAKYVNTDDLSEGAVSLNLKILYALYISQVNKDHKSFVDDARIEVIENIIGRFSSLVNGDIKLAEGINQNFERLLKSSKTFSIYAM